MSFEENIKKLTIQIQNAEHWVLNREKDKKKQEALIQKIGELKSHIDLYERANKNGKLNDLGKLEEDVLEHMEKLKKAEEQLQQVLPFGWKNNIDNCSDTPLEESKLKKLQKQLLQLKTEHEALEIITKMFATAAENSQTSQEEVLKNAKDAIKTYANLIKEIETYSENNLRSTPDKREEPKKEEEKKKKEEPQKEEQKLVVHNGKYEIVPKIEGEIKLNTGKTIAIKIEKLSDRKQFTIPQNTEGTLSLKVFLAFKFDGRETAYQHAKNISASIKSDSKGKVSFVSVAHNEVTSSKSLMDVMIQETIKIISEQHKKFTGGGTPKTEEIPEQAVYNFVQKNIKQQLMVTSIEAIHENNSPVLSINYKLAIGDLDISLNANLEAGIVVPVDAIVSGGTGIGVNLKGVKNSGGIQLVLEAAEERLDMDADLNIKFEKEGEITLDETDKKQLDHWWSKVVLELETTIRKEEAAKEANKDITKEQLERKVKRQLSKLLDDPKAYTITVKGFSSTTGADSKNQIISNQRAASIEKHLKTTLNIKGKIRIDKPDGEKDCSTSNDDNTAAAECRKASIYFLTN